MVARHVPAAYRSKSCWRPQLRSFGSLYVSLCSPVAAMIGTKVNVVAVAHAIHYRSRSEEVGERYSADGIQKDRCARMVRFARVAERIPAGRSRGHSRSV
jgi:hypothetical protein